MERAGKKKYTNKAPFGAFFIGRIMADNIHKISSDMATEIVGKKMKRTSASAWIARECKVCPYCKKEFVPRTHNQVTCGTVKCKNKHNAFRKKQSMCAAKCVVCGKKFKRQGNQGESATQTCGQKCADDLRKRNIAKTIIECACCGKPTPKRGATGKYCINCSTRMKRKRNLEAQKVRQTEQKEIKIAEKRKAIVESEPIDVCAMQTLISEFPTMDCPECDPLTNRMQNGVWFEVQEKPKQTRKAA